MVKKLKVFVSSKIQELADERRILSKLLPQLGDSSIQLETWVFEADARASSKSIRQVFLDALDDSSLYIGVFWNGYGEWTVDEFHRAGERGIPRHIYVKNVDSEKRDSRLTKFLEKQSDVRFGITPRWYDDQEDFEEQVSRSVRLWLQNQSQAYHSATTAVIATMPDDLPELPRRLIGRKKLTNRVLGLLEENERVLLRGFGGTGKSALAATIAADYIEAGLGNVIWIKAGNSDILTIYEALARAFNQQQQILSAEGEAQEHLIRQYLARSKSLLVLDDVWNGQTLSRLATVLPRRMPLLATSRQKFPLDEVIEIGDLDPDEAIKLLEYHARLDLSEDANAQKLTEKLGNHAFALEIAGKTLKVYEMSPSDLLARIENSPHDLNVPAGFGDLGRQGIKSLLDASIDALNQELYETYLSFGAMFEPTITTELMRRVLNKDAEETENALQELVQRGLLNERETIDDLRYYQLHDLAYSYARTSFGSKGLSDQAVIDACRDYAESYAAELPYLDIEIGNLLEAAETALEHEDSKTIIQIMSALAISGPYFAARGHTSRTMELMRAAIACAEEEGDVTTAHFLWGRLGNAYAALFGQLDKALEAYLKSLELARKMGNPQREAILLTVIGTVRYRQNADDADEYHQQAEAIARQNDDAYGLAQVLHNRGAQAVHEANPEPDYALGIKLSDEAAQIAKEHGIDHLYFYSMLNRGAGEHESSLLSDAAKSHQLAYDFAEQKANHFWMAESLYALGEDYHQMNRPDEARKHFENALKFAKETGAVAVINQIADYANNHDYQLDL
jgi:tetratricopeptide (TPR) repeat protein